MKKKHYASLLLVAPLALLGACSSTPTLALKANWFSNTSLEDIANFEETLEYKVTFEKSSSAANSSFYMEFPEGGTYKTTFTGGTQDGKNIYIYTTELSTKIRYTLGGTSREFTDTVTTCVKFLDVQNELKPLSSTREAHTTVPRYSPSNAPATIEEAYRNYNYTTATVYDHENNKATFTLTYLKSDGTEESKKTQEIKLSGKGLFFDNEQLVPMLRAAELSSSMSIRTIDPTTRTCEKLSVKDGPTTVNAWKQSVKLKGSEEATELSLNVNEISIAYSKQNSGGTHKYTLAQCGSRDSNTYRNVLLKYEYPVINSHGTLTYTLTAANFSG